MDKDTQDVLTAWGFQEYIEEFANQKIDSAALALLTEDHVKELIKPIGDRAKFIANLNEWRQIIQVVNTTVEGETDNNFNLSVEDIYETSNQDEPRTSTPGIFR